MCTCTLLLCNQFSFGLESRETVLVQSTPEVCNGRDGDERWYAGTTVAIMMVEMKVASRLLRTACLLLRRSARALKY